MATTLAFRFLPFLLFFFMNGHGIGASRDLKVEPRDQKEVDSLGAIPASRDEVHISGYRTTLGTTQPNYIISYTFKKHKRQSHHEKLNEPYITQYGNIGPKNDPKESAHYHNKPYITQYGDDHDSKQEPIETATTQDTTKPYVTNYGLHPKKDSKESTTQDSNKQYITQYGDIRPINDPKESTQYHNKPYVTQYGDDRDPTKHPIETITAQDSTKPYVTNYGLHPKKYSKESTIQDSNEPYISQYGDIGPKNDPKESAQDHVKPYITQYGDHDPKQDPKESTQEYTTAHKKKPEESKGRPCSHVDHTEAFKTGFFALDDLYAGNVMTLQFPVEEFSHFIPRKEADSIPFSTSHLSSVLQLFSIPEDSPQAESMRGTLEQCGARTITGETKICANSLESMLEFVNTIIGSEAKYDIHTTSYPTPSSAPLQKYTILEISQDIYAPKWVACHPLPYPYAVYYCHFIATGSKVFKVLLRGENESDKMEALGICHLDTSDWSPNHILFRQLGFKPGEAPVCHFFPVKHLMWVPQPVIATM